MQEEPQKKSDIVQGWNDSLEVADERPILADQTDYTVPQEPPKRRKHLWRIGAIVVVILAIGVTILTLVNHKTKPQSTVIINTQSLDNGTLNQLTKKSGEPAQTQLVIAPNTTFKNDVTVQGASTVQKDLSVNGALHVQGNGRFDSNLAAAKNVTVGGGLTVSGLITAGGLSVGTLTISTINLSGNVSFGGHLIPSGTAPSAKASVASVGGTVRVDGNDTAGTVVIDTGHGSAIAGEIAILTFRTPFSTSPKVQLTPLNDASSKVNYFVTRSATFFTVDASSVLSPDTEYAFDYLVTQ